MKQSLIIFLVLYTFAAAMVPTQRRAVGDDENLSSTQQPREICAPTTPCGWSVYNTETKDTEMSITNSYCDCAEGTICQFGKEDLAASSIIYMCSPPKEE